MIKLGFARKDITPDSPVPMAGYLVPNRTSKGVHDNLYARALYLEDSKHEPVVILQLDLLGLDRLCLDKIYSALEERMSMSGNKGPVKNRILICATHTHSGFGGFFDTDSGLNQELIHLFGNNNPELVKHVVDKSVEAVIEASKNCVETNIRINRGIVEGIGMNRRRADIPCDTSLFTIEFDRLDQKKILLYNLCCHPTALDSENLLLSADFPGAVAEKLEGVPGGYDMAVFINGSAGDMSTRFTRKESSFNECSRYANIILEALEGLKKGVFLPLEKAELNYHSVSLKKARPSDTQSAGINLQNAVKHLEELKSQNVDTAILRKAASLVEGAQIGLLKSNNKEEIEKSENKTIETGILRINDTTIVCSPLELFSSLALILKENKQVECFGYVNCLEGYLADIDAWDNFDYEALSGDFMRGEGERYIELVSALV
ncbi:MAG: neutral/alkaline non-lysosomal ceramidase N-terminal domain-containing protein [Treponema sp.]|nr:neutral/alkaline non-lysosomal ceramidase N-terminal domain-containing protein [Treponema sp.]